MKDDGISEELIKHAVNRLSHDRRYGIDPTKIKNDLGWYLEHEDWINNVTSGNYLKYYEAMYKAKAEI